MKIKSHAGQVNNPEPRTLNPAYPGEIRRAKAVLAPTNPQSEDGNPEPRTLNPPLLIISLLFLLPITALLGLSLIPACPSNDYAGSTILMDRHGQSLRVRLGHNDADCRPVSLENTGHWATPAIIAAEDKRFYRHPGIDPIAILRALVVNVLQGRIRSGASTISTQVVKLDTPRPRTLRTKIIEALCALRMEHRLSKDEILEQYLNRAPFGSNLTGLESASLRYFGKHASDLSLSEAATLAALPKAPSRLRPDRHPERARQRRDEVLVRMLNNNLIDREQFQTAVREPMHVRLTPPPFYAPHFCDLILQTTQASDQLITTLDTRLQETITGIVDRHASGWKGQHVHGMAVVLIEVRTGAIRALIGSPDYTDARHAGQVNGATARRSPGSALKPFVYAMAFDEGLCSPQTILKDEPMRFRQWDPENFNRDFSGPVSAREALVRSLNIPAIELTQKIIVSRLLRRFRRLGLSTLDHPADRYGLSLILGGGEVTLLDLANAYATLARGGEYRPYRLLESIENVPFSCSRFCRGDAAMLANGMLKSDRRGHRPRLQLASSFRTEPASRSNSRRATNLPWGCNRRRAWGRTSLRVPKNGCVSLPQLQGEAGGAGLVSAPLASTPQMGHDHARGLRPMPAARPACLQHKKMGRSQSIEDQNGIRLFSPEAVYLIHDILSGDERALQISGHVADGRQPRIAWKTGTSSGFRDAWTIAYNPEYVVGVWIGNPDGHPLPGLTGGEAAAPLAGDIFRALYPDGIAPWFERPDSLGTRTVCAAGGNLPSDTCVDIIEEDYIPGISPCTHCDGHHAERPSTAPPAIVSPVEGETYALLRNWPGGRQELPLIATGTADLLYWFIDGSLLTTGHPAETIYWPLEPGRHTIACATPLGHHSTVQITVE